MKLLQGLQKLKEGIETNNTDLIEEGYSLLTDEDINFPTKTVSIPIETPPTQIHIPELEKEIRQRANVGSENVQSLEMDFTMDKKKTKAEKKDFVNNFDPGPYKRQCQTRRKDKKPP